MSSSSRDSKLRGLETMTKYMEHSGFSSTDKMPTARMYEHPEYAGVIVTISADGTIRFFKEDQSMTMAGTK